MMLLPVDLVRYLQNGLGPANPSPFPSLLGALLYSLYSLSRNQ